MHKVSSLLRRCLAYSTSSYVATQHLKKFSLQHKLIQQRKFSNAPPSPVTKVPRDSMRTKTLMFKEDEGLRARYVNFSGGIPKVFC